jgi:hypothetical protein
MALVILCACLVFGFLTLTVGTRLAGNLIGGIAGAFGNSITRLTSQTLPTVPPSGVALDTPVIDEPANGGNTNQPSIPIQGTIPSGAVGKSGYSVNVYLVGKDGSQRKVASVPVGGTTRFSTTAVALAEGTNLFIAKLVAPSGEGGPSPVVTYVLDTKPPKITVTSPGQGAKVNAGSVDIAGKCDPGVTITVRNEQAPGGALNSGIVGTDGGFRLTVPIVAGPNTIDVAASDPAGNSSATKITVNRPYGQLAAHLSVSPSKFRSSSQTTLKVTLHASSFNGAPLANAAVTFTVTIQGLGPLVSPQIMTDATGTATWKVPVSGSAPGSGQASVIVTTSAGDVITATAGITTT